MRKVYSTRGRWPMALAAVAGAVMLGAPPAVAATGTHTGLTTFQPSSPLNSCPSGGNFGDELSLEYEGNGSLTVGTSVVPVHVEFTTAFAYMGPAGTYTDDTCTTAGHEVAITSASIVDLRGESTGSCTFDDGEYVRGPADPLGSSPTGEQAVFTTGTCSGSLEDAGPTVTNDGVSVCAFAPTQTYPQACSTTYVVS